MPAISAAHRGHGPLLPGFISCLPFKVLSRVTLILLVFGLEQDMRHFTGLGF